MAFSVRPEAHPSGTYGPIGGTAAVGRLMGFDGATIEAAMNLTAPLTLATSWAATVEGATVRDLYSGQGAALAVRAPQWLEAGFSGASGDVEHVLSKVSGTRFDAPAVADELGTRWEILRNSFKVHGCCGNFMTGIEVSSSRRKSHDSLHASRCAATPNWTRWHPRAGPAGFA